MNNLALSFLKIRGKTAGRETFFFFFPKRHCGPNIFCHCCPWKMSDWTAHFRFPSTGFAYSTLYLEACFSCSFLLRYYVSVFPLESTSVIWTNLIHIRGTCANEGCICGGWDFGVQWGPERIIDKMLLTGRFCSSSLEDSLGGKERMGRCELLL